MNIKRWLVVLVLLVLLGNLRAGLLVALVIPLAMIFAVIGMHKFAIAASLLSLGAIDFGIIVDGAVVMVENMMRRLGVAQHELARPPSLQERQDTLVSAAWLRDHLDDPDLVVIDATVLIKPDGSGHLLSVNGRGSYEAGHIPGAVFADFFGDLSDAVTIARGGFFQTTGGQWAFVVSESEEVAEKRNISLGRKNTRVYEVLEGLKPGEKVITSSYDNYGDVDKLVLN